MLDGDVLYGLLVRDPSRNGGRRDGDQMLSKVPGAELDSNFDPPLLPVLRSGAGCDASKVSGPRRRRMRRAATRLTLNLVPGMNSLLSSKVHCTPFGGAGRGVRGKEKNLRTRQSPPRRVDAMTMVHNSPALLIPLWSSLQAWKMLSHSSRRSFHTMGTITTSGTIPFLSLFTSLRGVLLRCIRTVRGARS